jgi:hypothetical protein
MAHRRSLHAQALPHRGICIGRTSKQAPGCRERCVPYRDRGGCLLAFSNQYRDHTRCADLAGIWGLPRGTQESGEGTLASQNGLSVRTAAIAMPNQTSVAAGEPRPLPCANRPAGIAPNERDLADGERGSGILCQALFRVDIQIVISRRATQKQPQGDECSIATGSQR